MEPDPRVGLRQLAPQPREPGGVPLVQPRAGGLRQRRVGDVADQRVTEPQRVTFGDQQVACHEPHTGLLDRRAGDPRRERVDGGRLEPVARDRGERQGGTLGGIERVQPRRQQRVQRRRQRVRRPPLADVGDELLEEQRVAARRIDHAAVLVRLEPDAAHRRHERLALGPRQRAQHQLDAALGTPLELVRAGDPDHEQRHVRQPREQLEQQVEQRGLGPVGIVDDQHERPPAGQRAEEDEKRPVGVLAGLALLDPDRGGDAPDGHRGDRQLGGELVGRAAAPDLEHRLAQGPERDALAVGGAAAGEDGGALAGDRVQLGDEARLSDPRLAEDGQQLGRALADDAGVGGAQQLDLRLAADQRQVEPAADRGSVGLDRAEQVAPAGVLDGAGGVAHALPRRLGEPYLAARGRPREPLGGGRRFADHGRRRGDDDLPGAEAAARAQAERERPGQLPGRTDRAQRVVLVRDGDAEDGQDGVAAQLGDAAAVAAAGRARRGVELLERGAQRLRVEPGDLVRVGELRERARHPAA